MPEKHRAGVRTKPTVSVFVSQQARTSLSATASPSDASTDGGERPLRVHPDKPLMYLAGVPKNAERFSGSPAMPESRLDYRVAKRVMDMALGTLLFIVAVPIILVAAAAIRYESPGSPFFVQTRLGRNGVPFKLYKLRGMYKDSRTRFPAFYDYSARTDLDFFFHHEVDPRVTPVGKFFRRTSIDELPNLWNVIKGDMSLVGPRPEIPEVLALYGNYREAYLSVKPGVTCLSKCTGRDKLTKRTTIEFDLDYIRRRCFRVDIAILWRTFRGVVLRRDVF